LVHRPSRPTSSRLRARYHLTDSGQRTFQQWLLTAPDYGRGQVVLRLLLTIAFNPDQREKLLALSANLELDNDQAEALSRWMTENSPRNTAPHTAGHDILMNLINRDSNEH
jgi:DNA-binding PadR family transcriptional regulator